MANVIHLVIHIHQYRQQPKEEQHIGRILGNSTLRQVRFSRLAVWLRRDIQTLLLIHQIKIVIVVAVEIGYRVQ